MISLTYCSVVAGLCNKLKGNKFDRFVKNIFQVAITEGMHSVVPKQKIAGTVLFPPPHYVADLLERN